MPTRDRLQPRLIGLAEYVDFPDWGISSLRAKVDTGARTSALHVEHVRERQGERVRFEVRLHRSDLLARVAVEAKIARRGQVRVSSGATHSRIFVMVRVRLGGVEQLLEVGLVDRRDMLYRMLLGRAAIEGRFVVDVTKRYVLGGAPSARGGATKGSEAVKP